MPLLFRVCAFGAALRADHLTGLQQLLETAQCIIKLTLLICTEYRGDFLTYCPADPALVENDPNLGAPIAGRWRK